MSYFRVSFVQTFLRLYEHCSVLPNREISGIVNEMGGRGAGVWVGMSTLLKIST